MAITRELRTNNKITWCPGCPNFAILESTARALLNLIKQGYKKEDFVMVAGIGCHAKIFDYLDISGINGLHGRSLPTAMGIKMGNPNLSVFAFAGDGDTYAEGMEHFIHACRFNSNMTLFVHDNQSFSLTTGQPTPTSQLGFKSKALPFPNPQAPINPLRIALSAGASFVARCNSKDIAGTAEIMEKAIKHNGFSFVEIIQDCLIFNQDMIARNELMYKLPETSRFVSKKSNLDGAQEPKVLDKKRSLDEAMALAKEWDYNLGKGKIALGVFFQENKKTFEEHWPQLTNLMKSKIGWKDIKR